MNEGAQTANVILLAWEKTNTKSIEYENTIAFSATPGGGQRSGAADDSVGA
jgi:hypothetical protein